MVIRNIILIALILLSLLSCNHTEKRTLQSDKSLIDKLDSTAIQNSGDLIEESEPSEEELFQKAYSNLINSYNKNEIVDSIFIIGTDSFRVRMEYRCLKNTSVVVPTHFLVPNMNKDFSTHDFLLKFIVLKNDEFYFKRTYEKKYFYKQLQNENLKKYGIIFSPYIELVEGNLIFGASISIPLTDVGEGVEDTLSLANLRK